ncbi:DUF1842 domain-containing protein [Magnetospirillum gryphiswaldense]|uniref:DUF1842 domain-containing protein n=2 Tax=Magnetospirillum gryphiswaldense TaxID=55518 RepID=V6EYS9_MAGGM|nr:DUF1842 domain-containing protein [Magnetospirillum gryphiswaldense]AVM74525.1 hypothetical protein MSR1_20360 [Magnetospirillum gryphiswaldense MSR-1]AVM78428.1 hypothetical protein MSR1L_20360 [Magnetospirillum gryphiswaldense]CAM75226.1 Methylase of polypeptide chain release factors [Magnetospirillum gryphiswaldense MSR-1]CDK97378.1 conserved protein of unknown function [Magnetospirillum gryphiswaldense MSR-1 v2]
MTFKSILAATMLTAAAFTAPAAMADNGAVGLFQACYQVGGAMPGAPAVNLHLAVNTPAQAVNGMGQITQATNPPLNEASTVSGNYSVMTVMPNNTHIQVRLTGYPPVNWPPQAGIGPVIPANLDMIMVLSKDWKSGDAQYQYRTGLASDWIKIASAPVKQVACNQPK